MRFGALDFNGGFWVLANEEEASQLTPQVLKYQKYRIYLKNGPKPDPPAQTYPLTHAMRGRSRTRMRDHFSELQTVITFKP